MDLEWFTWTAIIQIVLSIIVHHDNVNYVTYVYHKTKQLAASKQLTTNISTTYLQALKIIILYISLSNLSKHVTFPAMI